MANVPGQEPISGVGDPLFFWAGDPGGSAGFGGQTPGSGIFPGAGGGVPSGRAPAFQMPGQPAFGRVPIRRRAALSPFTNQGSVAPQAPGRMPAQMTQQSSGSNPWLGALNYGRANQAAGGGGWQGTQDPNNPAWWGPDHPLGSISDIIQAIIRSGGAGGAFGLNPPEGLMNALRTRAMGDYGAQQRQTQLALESNPNIDPSSFGFMRALSQVQGQRGVQDALNNADLGLRQQQLNFLQSLLAPTLGFQQAMYNTNVNRPRDPGILGSVLGGLGGLAGSIPGLGSIFGGGGGGSSMPTMGQPGYSYPYEGR